MRSLVNLTVIMTLLVWICQPACSQPSHSFETSLQKLKTADINNYQQVLEEIVQEQQQLDFDTAKIRLEKILQLSNKFSNKKAISYVLRELGDLHKTHQLYTDSYTYYEEALEIAETYDLPYEQAQSKSSLGILMIDQFKVNEAVVYFLEAADMFNEYRYFHEASKIYMRLGSINYRQQNFRRAINYYEKVFNTSSDLRDKMLVANNIGLAFYQKNELDNALRYYDKALEIAYALPDSFYIGLVSGNIGGIYIIKSEYEKAEEYLQRDIRLSKKYEEWGSAASAMVSLGTVYQEKRDFEMAAIYLDSATLISKRLDNIKLTIKVSEAYITKYQQQQNYQEAFKYLSLVRQLEDSLHRQLQRQRGKEIDAAYNFDKALAEIDYLSKNNKLQSLIISAFVISTGLLLVFSLVLGKLIRQRTHVNDILASQKKEIEQRNTELEAQRDQIQHQNKALEAANGQITFLNKKLEQKVRFTEEILRSAYENASEAYLIMRSVKGRTTVKDFVCLDVNRAAEQLLHHSKEELIGKRILKMLPFVGTDGYLPALTKVCEENTDFEQDIYLGEEGVFPAWVQMTVNPIEGGVAIKIKDISLRKAQEQKLKTSEASISAMINNTTDLIMSIDSDYRLTEFNEPFVKAVETQHGFTPQRGQSVFDAVHDVNLERAREIFERTLQGESTADHFEIPFRENKSRYAEAFFSPVMLEQQPIGATVVIRDITDRKNDEIDLKKAVNNLQESEERLRMVINNIPIILWTTNKDGIFTMSEGKALEKLALKPGEVVGISIFDLYADYEDQLKVLHNVLKNGIAYESTDKVGSTIFNAKVFPLKDEKERIIGLIGMSIDITERVAHEEKLKQQHQEIIKTNKKIADYKLMALRSVMNPHFLFNSLNSIQYFIAKNEREQALNYLSLFAKLIRNILNSSVNATIPIVQELEILKYYVELESLRFENKFEADFAISRNIDTDNQEIPSLLIQPYVENAIIHGLYNKEGNGKLTVSLSPYKDLLRCVVEDNGVGRKEAMRIKKQNAPRHQSVGMMVTKERLDIINKTNKVSVKIHDLQDEKGLACGTRVEILVQI